MRAADGVRYRAHFHHSDRAALVAVSARDGVGVGVARYVRHPLDRECAEVAVEVEDGWQHGYLVPELLTRLAGHARAQGISRMSAVLPADTGPVGAGSGRRVVTLLCPERDALACEVPHSPRG